MSTTSTRNPSAARQPARFTTVVVFPQPPFWFTIAITRMPPPHPAPARDAPGPRPGSAGTRGGPVVRAGRLASSRSRARSRAARSTRSPRLAQIRRGPLPGSDLALEARHLEDPLLAGDRVEGGAVAECEHHVPGRDQHELGERALHAREQLREREDGAADALDRDAGVDEPLRSLER